MKPCEWLEQVRKLDILIDAKLEERARLYEIATKITPNLSDDMPHAQGGVSDPVGDSVVKLIILCNEINTLIDRYVDYKNCVLKVLESLPEKEYAVLHKHYIQYKTWEKVAEELDCSRMQVWRITQKALKNLESVIECYTKV
jgi:hypothetical protein